MNSGQEIPRQLVVTRGNAAKVFEATEAALDDVSSPVSSFIEAMKEDAIGLVGDHGLGATIDDLRTQRVAVVPFVRDQRAHRRRKRQNIGGSRDIGILARREMKSDWPAEGIAQRMDLGRAPAARAADRLIVLPPFPPEAQR